MNIDTCEVWSNLLWWKKDKVEEMGFFQLLYNKSIQSIEAQNNSDLLFLLIVGQLFFFFSLNGVAKVG